MINSRKKLIAQIDQVEMELYQQREQAKLHQNPLSKNSALIVGVALGIGALLFLCRSKKSVKKTVHVVANAGQLALLAYFKKQIAQFFEKN